MTTFDVGNEGNVHVLTVFASFIYLESGPHHPGVAVVIPCSSSIRRYQHNTTLNMFEHIPSNPKHTVIRGDCTNTCCSAAKLCKCVRVGGFAS